MTLNIDNPYFAQLVSQIYPAELQLIRRILQILKSLFGLRLVHTHGIVTTKIYDKLNDLSFEIVHFPFLDGDVLRSPSYGLYILQLVVDLLFIVTPIVGVCNCSMFCCIVTLCPF